MQNLRIGGHWCDPWVQPIFCTTTDKSLQQGSFFFHWCSLFQHWLHWKAANGLERIFMRSTGKKNSRKAWICAVAVAIYEIMLKTVLTRYQTRRLKAIADNNINEAQMIISAVDDVENITRKGKNASYQHFLLLPQCFQKASLLGSLSWDCVVKS